MASQANRVEDEAMELEVTGDSPWLGLTSPPVILGGRCAEARYHLSFVGHGPVAVDHPSVRKVHRMQIKAVLGLVVAIYNLAGFLDAGHRVDRAKLNSMVPAVHVQDARGHPWQGGMVSFPSMAASQGNSSVTNSKACVVCKLHLLHPVRISDARGKEESAVEFNRPSLGALKCRLLAQTTTSTTAVQAAARGFPAVDFVGSGLSTFGCWVLSKAEAANFTMAVRAAAGHGRPSGGWGICKLRRPFQSESPPPSSLVVGPLVCGKGPTDASWPTCKPEAPDLPRQETRHNTSSGWPPYTCIFWDPRQILSSQLHRPFILFLVFVFFFFLF